MNHTDMITRFNDAKTNLAACQTEYDLAAQDKDAFIKLACDKHNANPTGCSGYEEQTTPISNLGRAFKERTEQGNKLVAMRPYQFSVVMVWQPKSLKPADVEKVNRQHAESEWSRHFDPIASRLASAEQAYNQTAAEVAALKDVFAQL